MKTKKIKNITLNDLARMTQAGFLDIDKKFGATDKRFEAIDKRFDAIDQRFEIIDKKLDVLEYEMRARFNHLEKLLIHEYQNRIEKLEDQAKELQADFRRLIELKR